MNKQEVLNKLQSSLYPETSVSSWDEGYNTGITQAIRTVTELDTLDKEVVPQFVADWYEDHKDDFEYNLYNLCTDFRKQKLRVDLFAWFGDDNNKPIETLVKMKLFGYEVEKEKEKEKLYTVELPNPNTGGHVVLCKTSDGIVSISFTGMVRWKGGKNFQLTESEIKKDFEWAWQFAEEVEKCNQKHLVGA